MRIVLPALLLALLRAATPIDAEEVSSLDLFKLRNDCKPIYLAVEEVDEDSAGMGLTRDSITTTVRSRLRAARLYDSEIGSYLYVRVGTVGRAFTVILEFKKLLFDPISGRENAAATWDTSRIGEGWDAGYILSWVSQMTDEFIDEYLRVNEPACSRSPLDP